jgi:Protein of unknown function, DUF481
LIPLARQLDYGPLLAAAALCCSTPAAADELITTNGETLHGVVLEEHADRVIFRSATFGTLTVPRTAIARLARTQTSSSAGDSAAPDSAAPSAPASPGDGTPAGTAESAPASPGGIGELLARINPLKGWKSSFALGYTARRGEDSDNTLYTRLRSERTARDGDEHLLEARYDYAEDVLVGGVREATDQLATAGYQYRHSLSARFFLQSNTGYYRDVIKELKHEVTQTAGVGVRFDRAQWKTSLTPAIGLRYRNIAGEESTQFVVGAYQSFEAPLTQTLKLRESLYYLVAPDRTDDYSLRLGLELTQKLSAIWSLGFRYDYDYDAIVGKDANRFQQRWALTLGLEF